MFNIEYKIFSAAFDDIDTITEEQIQYNFLLGSVWLSTEIEKMEMGWEWIPLLDFSFCLSKIVNGLRDKDNSTECFEFTESNEIIKFSKTMSEIKISGSFSDVVLSTSFNDFEKGVNVFHRSISKYIRENVLEIKSSILSKFLVVQI